MTVEDFDALGSVEGYRRLKAARPRKVSVVALYALEAALLGIAWIDLPLKTPGAAMSGGWEQLAETAVRLDLSRVTTSVSVHWICRLQGQVW